MDAKRIVDVTEAATFGLLPPCANPSFDHRSCDYWEDADRGSKAHRSSWLRTGQTSGAPAAPRPVPANPFLADLEARDDNPFALKRSAPVNPFALDDDDSSPVDNPFAPKRAARPTVGPGAAPKLALLGRGLAVFGSYAKVLLVEEADGERAVAYAQFGPLSAYPRALRLRELYPRLPQTPLPAVITCVAVAARCARQGSRTGARGGDLRGPGGPRLRGRGGIPRDRTDARHHLGRHAGVLGAGRFCRRDRRRALPGGAARALSAGAGTVILCPITSAPRRSNA